jgi:hypothetical protein
VLACSVEDSVLMTGIQLSLILIYTCVLLLKTCGMSAAVCSTFGFGDTSQGVRKRNRNPARPYFVPSPFNVNTHGLVRVPLP